MRVPFPPASKITETLRSATACIHKCQLHPTMFFTLFKQLIEIHIHFHLPAIAFALHGESGKSAISEARGLGSN